MTKLGEQSTAALLSEIAGSDRAPAGGVACALGCATAAALVELTAALAADRVGAGGRGGDEPARLRALGAHAAELRARALAAADDDAAAYAQVKDADDADREATLERASEPPLTIAECAAACAAAAAEVVAAGTWPFTPDAVIAGELAATAAGGAALLVAANLAGSPRDPRVARARAAADAAARAREPGARWR